MIVECEECKTAFRVDDRLIRETGTRLRCSRCKHVFRVYPPPAEAGPEPVSPIVAPSPDVPEDPPDEDRPLEAEQPPDALLPVPRSDTAKPERRKRNGYISFKTRLMYFAAILIGFIALIVIPIEAYRPIQQLRQLIENGKNLAGGTRAAFNEAELARLNTFTLDTISNSYIHLDKNRNYFFLSFNMLLTEGEILPAEKILKRMESFDDFGGREKFSYEALKESAHYWKRRFAEDPGALEIFRKYKYVLMRAVENAAEAGFELSSIMVMFDSGRKDGFFKDYIAYVLNSFPWWDAAAYSGEPYEITPENEFWRASALTGKGGYGHNPLSDPNNWYLPRFDEDEWGAWFSVWLTTETAGNYNILSIDFDASIVKRSLMVLSAVTFGVILLLFTVSLIIANWYSGLVTRPIRELTRGAEEVASGNYAYEVPVIREDELGEFTKQFNRMTQGQRERLNLMETLEKFLSKELAEKAASSGLVLGGKKADCTVMFTDFAGFSTITQQMTATEAVNVLNSYYDGLIPIIKKYGGFPDKYIGDAIVAMFGAPVSLEDNAERAVACAIEMQWKMREINDRRKREGQIVFEMRIGLNSGEVIAGAIGCDQKLEYTTIGETTNLANRMESICDIGHVMIADGTYQQVRNIFFKGVHIAMTPDQIEVKGYPEPVAAYRVYVDNLDISKNIRSYESLRKFYAYERTDHDLKYSPGEVNGGRFDKTARFIRE
ncbi:hypothetical protein DENIS_4401 [Desulfonema ishimotonii]|uniref:Adenylate/guanylate cyclase domain-containing protein n=1 Tax=Desulfonema ishimotonii TaxID=45657 RepID=A0A401G2F8_9BACT|nr:adenylate/guanylate cyclase domain-containing protein [Desulfonema ishimotonii]GBC63407.1 hypothetical protein DENIS_4401 [Desulfonema ishimotonii]